MTLSIPIIIISLITIIIASGIVGYYIGWYSVFEIRKRLKESKNECKPDLDNPQTKTTLNFKLKFPGNWTIVEEFDNFQESNEILTDENVPLHYFLIHSPAYNAVTFYFEFICPQKTIEKFVLKDAINENIIGSYPEMNLRGSDELYKSTPLRKYGCIEGNGLILHKISEGFFDPLNTYRIMCKVTDKFRVTIVERCEKVDEKIARPGFDLIENSLEIL